jgi:hypothetical protein
MTAYNRRSMKFAVEHVDEVGITMIRFTRARRRHGVEIRDADGWFTAIVHLDAHDRVVDVEVLDVDGFALDEVAADFGFTACAGAIGRELGRISAALAAA